ncbi:putative secreted protein [Litoreibacter ponti]|uniref:Putative secreted protein n=1 Tax=Litoreibacter ponti TaxID=1510457 RepID=A0A2T6BKN7_9RHOB|nr:hypothetical protein [Litoreibacter ponti]PTX56624.1 putative secreted protein [Litoreibacter ponti]
MINKYLFAVLAILAAGPAAASSFTLDVTGSCGLSAPTINSPTSLSEANGQQCNNLSSGSTGNLLGSRNVQFSHEASHGSISSTVRAITETTDLISSSNTGASVRIDTTNAIDTLSFSGGPSEFELMVMLDFATNVTSTVTSASFVSFNLGMQRVGGSGGMASDSFKVLDYATRPDLEVFDVSPIKILINNGAQVNLNASLSAQATSGSIAGENDNDLALAEGMFSWALFVPEGVQISASSGFDYNQSDDVEPVPLPAGGVLLLSSLGLLAMRARRRKRADA